MAQRIKSQQGKDVQKTVLLLGAGYSARALIPHLKAQGYRIAATTRTEEKAKALRNNGVDAIIHSGAVSSRLVEVLSRADIILSSIPPNDLGDPFLNGLKTSLLKIAKNASWVGYLSATSVYGNRNGQWAYEDELLRPLTQRGKNRMRAELQWLETGLPVHIFRLAGIYGPNRSSFSRLRQGKARAVIKPGHIVNRIHVEDISSAVLKSIETPNPVRIYNLADGHPAPPQDVINFAADLIDIARPPELDHNDANISDMARSFYVETKRINSNRAKTEFGWTPKYQNYRQGLMATLRAEKGEIETVWLSGWLDVQENDLANIKRALPAHIRLSEQETDCVSFRVWQDRINPLKFNVIESFKSPKAFRRHQARMKNSEWAMVSRNAVRHYDIIGL